MKMKMGAESRAEAKFVQANAFTNHLDNCQANDI